MTELKRRI